MGLITLGTGTLANDGITLTAPATGNVGSLSLSGPITNCTVVNSHGISIPFRSSAAAGSTLTIVLDVFLESTEVPKINITSGSNLTDTASGSPVGQTNVSVTNTSLKSFHRHDNVVVSPAVATGFSSTYAAANPSANQEITFDIPAGNANNRYTLDMLTSVVVSTLYQSHIIVNNIFATGFQVFGCQTDGSSDPTLPTSPFLSMNNAKAYRFRIRAQEGTLGVLVQVQVTNITDSTPLIWNSGSDTFSVVDPDGGLIGKPGAFNTETDSGTYSAWTYWDDTAPATLVPGKVSVITVDQTAATIHAESSTGGTPPYTWAFTLADDINKTNPVAAPGGTANQTDFTLTGLTPDKTYAIGMQVTDSASVTADAYDIPSGNYLNLLTGWDTLKHAFPAISSMYQIGDSLTHSGSPQTIGTAATLISLYTGKTIAANALGIPGGGLASFINADFTLTSDGGSTITEMVSFGATDLLTRLGINDSITKADFKARLKSLIAQYRAGVPMLQRILLLPTFSRRDGAPDESVPAGDTLMSQYIDAQSEVVAEDAGGSVRVAMAPMLCYYLWNITSFTSNYKVDPLHLTQAGYDLIGTMDGWSWLFIFGADLAPSQLTKNLVGNGLTPTPLTFTSDGSTPIANAIVWITSDSAGLIPVTGILTTNGSGVVTANLSTGNTYYANCTSSGRKMVNQSFVA